MLASVFLFEFQQRLRRFSTYVYFVVFFALGLLFTLMSGGAFAAATLEASTLALQRRGSDDGRSIACDAWQEHRT